jgi:hypothetical protein
MGFFNDMKTCRNCKTEKELINFGIDKYQEDGYNSLCKCCRKEYYLNNLNKRKEYLVNNSEHIKKREKEYNLKNKEYKKSYYIYDKHKRKEYYLVNKLKIKQYQINNNDKIKKQKNKYYKNKIAIDSLFKLSSNIRTLIRMSIKGNGYTKKSKTYQILGCSFEEFKQHLESQFTEGMTWDNQGKWHLDHIYPVSLATDEQHLIKLNHYTNFQPLWAEDNIKKSNKLNRVAEN